MKDRPISFLGIGAARARTTWLWKVLKRHPGIWLPPKKELHFFDRSLEYDTTPSYLATNDRFHRLFGKEKNNRDFRKLFVRDQLRSIFDGDWFRFRWNIQYYLGDIISDWYLSLFEHGNGKVVGEITPSYSILNLADVQNIRELFPNLKIIFLLRNPIYRALSHVRYQWTRNRIPDIENPNAIIEFVNSPDQKLRSDYRRTENIWSSCFPKNQIFIDFYDAIIENPAELIRSLFKFLEVSPPNLDQSDVLDQKFNVASEVKIPMDVKRNLAEIYYTQLKEMSSAINYPCGWLKEAEAILG